MVLLTHNWEDKGLHTFPKGICPKVIVIVRLEYELAYYDSAFHRFNHEDTLFGFWDLESVDYLGSLEYPSIAITPLI